MYKVIFLLTASILLFMTDAAVAQTQLGTDIDGEAASDQSGQSVSLSADGSRIAIGGSGNNGNDSNSGHVRIYDLSGGTWVQVGGDIDGEAADDKSGISVSLSKDGSRVTIGGSGNDGNGSNSGHVRIYDLSGGTWVQVGGEIDGEAADDFFGIYGIPLQRRESGHNWW